MRGMVFFLMRGTKAVGGTLRTDSHHDGCTNGWWGRGGGAGLKAV